MTTERVSCFHPNCPKSGHHASETTDLGMLTRFSGYVLTFGLLFGCAPRMPHPLPSASRPATFRVAVAAGQGDAIVSQLSTLESHPKNKDSVVLLTSQTEGSLSRRDAEVTFDSRSPSPADPWPITLQHAVAQVPAQVRYSAETGQIMELVDVESWKNSARSAIRALRLPPEAIASGDAMVDPEGLLGDLRRYFPGSPSIGSSWRRADRIGGVMVTREETCALQRQKGQRIYQCTGVFQAQDTQVAYIQGAASTTNITIDKQGLVRMESQYSGTLHRPIMGGSDTIDQPIYGRRVVQRAD